MIFSFVGFRGRGALSVSLIRSGVFWDPVGKKVSSDFSCQGYHVRFVSDLIPVSTECRHRRACDGREK